MARPRSDEKRGAIIAAATRVIAAQGLGAATAAIAQEAGVSNGSLFTYFETKADLLNHLYLELKTEMAAAALEGLPAGESGVRAQCSMHGPAGCGGRHPAPKSAGRSRISASRTTSLRRRERPRAGR